LNLPYQCLFSEYILSYLVTALAGSGISTSGSFIFAKRRELHSIQIAQRYPAHSGFYLYPQLRSFLTLFSSSCFHSFFASISRKLATMSFYSIFLSSWFATLVLAANCGPQDLAGLTGGMTFSADLLRTAQKNLCTTSMCSFSDGTCTQKMRLSNDLVVTLSAIDPEKTWTYCNDAFVRQSTQVIPSSTVDHVCLDRYH
jgi:hypothetical protein